MPVVYQHKKKGTNQVFYIGIGNINRPHDKGGRNDYWKNIVNKYGYDIEILFEDVSYETAEGWEKYLIDLLGRSVTNEGHLCNITKGGDARSGLSGALNPMFGKTRDDLSSYNRKRSGKNHPFYGKKRPEVSKKISGELNPMFGKTHTDAVKDKLRALRSKIVIDTITGRTYTSAIEAAGENNINVNTLRAQLIGRLTNSTSLRYL